MQCEAFEDRLNAVLDERRRPECDAELVAHTAGCPACRQLAKAYQILLDGFYELATPEPPADLAERVMQDRARATERKFRRWVVVPALATAAAVLLAALPWLRTPQGDTAPAGSPIASRASAPRPLGPGSLGPGTLSQISIVPEWWVGAKDPYKDLAKGTGQNLAAVMLYVPGIGGTKGIIDAESELGTGEPTWADQVSEGLKPVSDSVAETLNLILESLPVNQLASRS